MAERCNSEKDADSEVEAVVDGNICAVVALVVVAVFVVVVDGRRVVARPARGQSLQRRCLK